MKKFLLIATAAVLSIAAFAEKPSVDPTPGMATVVFKAPQVTCDNDITYCGDVQGYDPTATDLPVAIKVRDDGDTISWYKIVLPLTEGGTTEGKLCPKSLSGTGVWDYQAKKYTLPEDAPEWISIVDDYGTQNKIKLAVGCESKVVYVNVTEWGGDFCTDPNPAGEATFQVSFEIPAEVDPADIALQVKGQGEGMSWGDLGEIFYDETFGIFKALIDVPAGCTYKYLISYKGGEYIYMKGDNLRMPKDMSAIDEVTEWDSDPFVEPIEGGEGTFTVTFEEMTEGKCIPTAAEKVFIAGNFEDTPGWERVYEMTKTDDATWTYEDLTYPAGFTFKFVVQYLDEQGELLDEKWAPGDNIKFDGATYDYTVEADCYVPSSVDEVAASQDGGAIKVIENGAIYIYKNGIKYNMLGVAVK